MFRAGYHSTQYGTYVYSYLTPETDGDADAHADTDHAGHCQEQPHLEILRDITLGQKLL